MVLRLAGGLAVSMAGGHFVIWPLVERVLWPRIEEGHPSGTLFHPTRLTFLTGVVERGLYTLALFLGFFQWVGLWLGVKVIARWQTTEEESNRSKGAIDVWLIGNAIGVVFGFLGAWLALGHLPYLK
jgi:hypothetical protein